MPASRSTSLTFCEPTLNLAAIEDVDKWLEIGSEGQPFTATTFEQQLGPMQTTLVAMSTALEQWTPAGLEANVEKYTNNGCLDLYAWQVRSN